MLRNSWYAIANFMIKMKNMERRDNIINDNTSCENTFKQPSKQLNNWLELEQTLTNPITNFLLISN